MNRSKPLLLVGILVGAIALLAFATPAATAAGCAGHFGTPYLVNVGTCTGSGGGDPGCEAGRLIITAGDCRGSTSSPGGDGCRSAIIVAVNDCHSGGWPGDGCEAGITVAIGNSCTGGCNSPTAVSVGHNSCGGPVCATTGGNRIGLCDDIALCGGSPGAIVLAYQDCNDGSGCSGIAVVAIRSCDGFGCTAQIIVAYDGCDGGCRSGLLTVAAAGSCNSGSPGPSCTGFVIVASGSCDEFGPRDDAPACEGAVIVADNGCNSYEFEGEPGWNEVNACQADVVVVATSGCNTSWELRDNGFSVLA